MNSKHLIIASIVLFGSLWGLAELGIGEAMWSLQIPRAALLTAIGVLFLVMGRRAWSAPGSSMALATVAASFKFLQHPFWGCKVAAVLMVGAVFEIGFTMVEARLKRRNFASLTRGAALGAAPVLSLVSFVLFAYFARDVLHNPYWAMPDKMTDYMFVQGPIAAVLSLPAALAGLALSSSLRLRFSSWTSARWLAYRVAAALSGIAGVAAALALRY
jgi:hypothetical protein